MTQNNGKMCLLLLATIAWLQCFFFPSPVHADASVGLSRASARLHHPHGRNHNAFSWQASVDRSSGIALSKEVMKASAPHNAIARHFVAEQERQAWADILQRLEGYPEWLARGAVTFGLLLAVPLNGGGFALRDRIFGIHLLTFGVPQSQRFSFPKWDPPPPPLTDSSEQEALPLPPPPPRTSVEYCTVTIPILGGLLALDCKEGNAGCLKFTLKHDDDEIGQTQLVTEIRGYRPFLLGSKEPVPLYRKCLYLSTQSLLHAYVMWRFQRHVLHTIYSEASIQDHDDKTMAAVEGYASYTTRDDAPSDPLT